MNSSPFLGVILLVSFSVPLSASKFPPETKTDSIERSKGILNSVTNGYDVQIKEDAHFFKSSSETFTFTSSIEIDEVVANGDAKLENYSIDGLEICCLVSCIKDQSQITFNFYKDNAAVDTETLFFAVSVDNICCSSSISIDHARRAAGQSLNYKLSIEEEDSSKKASLAQTNTIGVTGSVSGTLKWTDEQGNIHPLIGAKVKVTINGSRWNSITYTNQTGYYSVNYYDIWYVGSGRPVVHVYTEDENIRVHDDGTYEHFHEFDGSSGNWVYDYIFSPNDDKDSNLGKAMMIFQGAKNFADYAEYLNGDNSIPLCNFKFPVKRGGYYSNGTVYLGNGLKTESVCASTYAAWDVIGHEYGHHVQKCFDLSDNPGGTHYLYHNNIDDQKSSGYSLEEAKIRGHKLSWGEGWATYWSTVAQSHFPEDLKSINTVGDTYYSSETFRYNLDSYSLTDESKGDADEVAIQRILFKLYSETIDLYDKFSLGDLTVGLLS